MSERSRQFYENWIKRLERLKRKKFLNQVKDSRKSHAQSTEAIGKKPEDEIVEPLPDILKGFSDLYRVQTEGLKEEGYTEEQVFWYSFAIISLYVGNPNAKIEVRLSQIFRLYLTIYCETVDKEMKIEEESKFIELLKQKYEKIRKIVLTNDDSIASSKDLTSLILGKEANVIEAAFIGASVPSFAYSRIPQPFNIIKDV